MKRYLLYMLISFVMLSFLGLDAKAQSLDSKRVDSLKTLLISEGVMTDEEWNHFIRQRRLALDTVPVKQRESERKRKRMITNYRYVAKGDIAVGLAFSFANYDTDNSQFFSIVEDFSGTLSAFSVKPFVAYFYNHNSCVGFKYANSKIDGELNSLYVDIDEDLNFDMGRTTVNYVSNNLSLIHRSYVGLDRGHRFGLFNETSLGYIWGNMDYFRTLESGPKSTSTEIQELRLGINPGLSVFVMDKFTVEASVGIVGFNLHRERQTTNGLKSGWRKSAGMDYKFNIFNIQIGLVAYL